MSEDLRDRLTVPSNTKNLLVVRDFVSRAVRLSRLPGTEENRIVLAVDEAVTNIIEHGYESAPGGRIEVEVDIDERRLRIVIRDGGREFDPATHADPFLPEHVRDGKKRGLGIFLMRQIMDEVSYQFRDGRQNELTLIKYIP